MTHQEVMTMLGCKYYRQLSEDKFEILRVTNIKGTNDCTCLIDNERVEIKTPQDILSHYTKLIPDGTISFAIVSTQFDDKKDLYCDDVMVLAWNNNIHIHEESPDPDVICRQNIIDIFYAMLNGEEDKSIVGLSMTKKELPNNLSMKDLTQCDKINYIVTYNTYLQDTPTTFIEYMKGKRLQRFNDVLENGVKEYLKSQNIVDMGQKIIKGHCRDLENLLKNNNFYYDFDQIFGISPIKDNIEENLESNNFADGTKYYSLNSKLTNIFSNVFKINISKTIVVEYDHDIDLTEFDPNTIFLVRDNTDKVYVVRYMLNGEYLESELELEAISQAFDHIRTVNKYSKIKKSN